MNNDVYSQYIQKLIPTVDADILSKINVILANTSWDNPNSSADWNNLAVIALIEAEQCIDNLDMRSVYLEMAFEALNNGFNIDQHPLCAAHLALIHSMIGEKQRAIEIAIYTLISTLQSAYTNSENDSSYLIYICEYTNKVIDKDKKYFEKNLLSINSYQQALILLGEIISYSQVAFYTYVSRRFLYIADQLLPKSVDLGLKLGISNLMGGQPEGLLYLHQARNLEPDYAPILQSLFLAYRDLNQIEIAAYWQEASRNFHQSNSRSPEWCWTQLQVDSLFTYVPFEDDLIMAVEPSLRSIVTSVLITEQDWFEKEMEFWRNSIKPGMTVIDVGANVGVYTFSAALKVGSQGRVLAVEPFSGCVRCLQETCRINQLPWVKVCAGAASDRNGTIKLLLHSANELNQVIAGEAIDMPLGSFEEVPCFTLDSLIEQENIEKVDFLKIDAEGHEMAVLAGSQKLIAQFAPVILYENIAGSQGSNIEVAQYLENIGYTLFHYQPYLQKLIPVNSDRDFQEQLNFIAVPPQKTSMFNFN
ncbi:MAG: FkbM family methyltransferase [Chlorogloeopsis fritschii C42_A2020_084]|uniref:FkbM family methyltransferase n=1 Tax=Chlorogloeopsis fritschii TaxID=1124 RepID=UPI001A0CA704|nr:FkbM family methyltransferase [Chlorogloeopsis fritschii]MBF2009304.1 FkbM family methyltransferase [Chlorogloeopsis fritschii C42_A2020_084]